MFSFFKKKKTTTVSKKAEFDIELTAAVLAYEVARIDGNVSERELNILMEEIKNISKLGLRGHGQL